MITTCNPNPCLNGGQCVQKGQQFYCKCLPNNQFLGQFCQHLNPCFGSNRCLNGGTCLTIQSSSSPQFKCLCRLGFSASLCEIQLKSICDSNPCLNGGQCLLKTDLNSYECLCSSGNH